MTDPQTTRTLAAALIRDAQAFELAYTQLANHHAANREAGRGKVQPRTMQTLTEANGDFPRRVAGLLAGLGLSDLLTVGPMATESSSHATMQKFEAGEVRIAQIVAANIANDAPAAA